MRYLLFNDPIFRRESRIYYTNLFRARYIAERKNDRAHGGESILRNPTFESGLHGSSELFSGFSGWKLLSDLLLRTKIRARARTCRHVLKRVIDRPNIYFPRGQEPTMKVSADLEVDLRKWKIATICYKRYCNIVQRYAFNKYFIISPNFSLF